MLLTKKDYATPDQAFQAKIDAVNIANQFANQFSTKLHHLFKPLINKKVLNKNADPLSKINNKIYTLYLNTKKEFYSTYKATKYKINIWRTTKPFDDSEFAWFSLTWNLSVNVNQLYPFIDEVHTAIINVSRIDNNNPQFITHVLPPTCLKTDYTLKDMKTKQKKYLKLKTQSEAIQLQISPLHTQLLPFIDNIERYRYTKIQ